MVFKMVRAHNPLPLPPYFPSPDLIQCTNEMNVNIPQLADTLFERTTNTSWVVVFKSLITTHHLMVYGNEASAILHPGSKPEFACLSSRLT